MNYDKIRICLEQKNIFMENIVNYSKQLEVKAEQEELNFEDILEKRQDSMNRIDKCQSLINSELEVASAEATDGSDELKQITAIKKLVSLQPLEDEQYTNELRPMQELTEKYKVLLAKAIKIDKKAMEIAQNRQEMIKQKLVSLRPANPNQNLYR